MDTAAWIRSMSDHVSDTNHRAQAMAAALETVDPEFASAVQAMAEMVTKITNNSTITTSLLRAGIELMLSVLVNSDSAMECAAKGAELLAVTCALIHRQGGTPMSPTEAEAFRTLTEKFGE